MNSHPIDLRSDTVTRPTPGMYEAMVTAPVGDDVYGEDPSVNQLQHDMTELFGMEAGLFVPTGVMSNQLAIKAWTRAGDEVIVEEESHIFNYETAAPSMMSAVQLRTVRGALGILDPGHVVDAIRPTDYYYPKTALVCIENTHNRCGGTLYPIQAMRELSVVCRERNLPLHLDGARIWNAHIASGTPLAEFGGAVDSISICFSKGLGAPVGSMLLGPSELIARAHKYRKIFGGGMRQAGVLAAAAAYAVREHLALLNLDHLRAGRFAEALCDSAHVLVDRTRVQSNMVLLDFSASDLHPEAVRQSLREQGVLIGMGMGRTLRAVFHIGLSDADVDRAIDICTAILR
jgi:threonine aldolase